MSAVKPGAAVLRPALWSGEQACDVHWQKLESRSRVVMFRVTLREMFWLCTIAALVIGWMIDARFDQTNEQILQIRLMEERLNDATELVRQLQSVAKRQSEGGGEQM
jgi:hypothetical protein